MSFPPPRPETVQRLQRADQAHRDAKDASLRRLARALLDKLDGMGKAMLSHDSDLDRFWSLGFNAAKKELVESAEYTALRKALEG